MIWLNLQITCAAVAPLLFEGLLRLFANLRGDWVAIPMMFAVVVLDLIGLIGYVVCAPVLLSVCVLLMSSGIPCRVKLATASLELGACALLFWDVGRLEVLHRSLA